MNKIYIYLLLVLITLGAGFLRIYKLDKVPASLNWDEVAAGYNAYTIANWGKDEWGKSFPIVFTSFRDDKHPVHIYITAIFVKLLGLTDFSTRLPSAIVGTLSVLVIFFLGKKIFESDLAGLFAALFLAISPYHLQFSRGLWELNFALFFYLLGLTFFLYGIKDNKKLLPFSMLGFGLSFFSYHSAKVLVPPTIIFLIISNYRDFSIDKKYFYLSLGVVGLFALLTVLNPRILGFARAQQTKFSDEEIMATTIFSQTKNKTFALGEVFLNNYLKYFDYKYLFLKGDQSSRNSIKVIGQFYQMDSIFILLGIFTMLKRPKWSYAVLIFWILLAPIPGALSTREPSAARGIFMLGALQLVAAFGISRILENINKKVVVVAVSLLFLSPLANEFKYYLNYYYKIYPAKDAIEWQYGMKDVVEYISKRNGVNMVYMDKIRQQPYIFFLFYLKTPLPKLLETVQYDQSESKSYNTVLSFGHYQFGGWDPIESYPSSATLYAITPSYYSGLRYINSFSVDKLIKYPDGGDAFYIVEGDK